MRQDILKIITSAKDITNAVILTHNIDFVFVQSVVIPALRKCGSPSLTIFADAECAAQTYQHQARVLGTLGQRYRVVPVAMKPGFHFHPKAVLLSGPTSATLLVGSGNLTFGGWRENGEVWSRYDSDNDGTQALAAFREYLREVLEICPESDALTPEIEEAFDPNTRRLGGEHGRPRACFSVDADRAGRCSTGSDQLSVTLLSTSCMSALRISTLAPRLSSVLPGSLVPRRPQCSSRVIVRICLWRQLKLSTSPSLLRLPPTNTVKSKAKRSGCGRLYCMPSCTLCGRLTLLPSSPAAPIARARR